MQFTDYSTDAKFATAVAETFKAMQKSVQAGNPVLTAGTSTDATLTEFIELSSSYYKLDKAIADYILTDTDFNYNLFVETMFALYFTALDKQ
jgi:hypothetical protein